LTREAVEDSPTASLGLSEASPVVEELLKVLAAAEALWLQ
jgi:hypothetical protein